MFCIRQCTSSCKPLSLSRNVKKSPKVIQNHTYFLIPQKMCHKIYALLKCLLLSIVWVMNLRPKYPVWSLGQCRIPKLWISDKRRTILGKLPREDLKSKLWRAKIHWKNLWNILKNTLGQSEKYFVKLWKILWKTLKNTLEYSEILKEDMKDSEQMAWSMICLERIIKSAHSSEKWHKVQLYDLWPGLFLHGFSFTANHHHPQHHNHS